MAIIYSYPEKTSPAGGDFLVITDSQQTAPNKNRTKSLTIDNLASYVVSSTSGITGSGTIDAIPKFTPTGVKIGDSIMTEIGGRINVAGRLSVAGDLEVTGYARFKDQVQDNANSPGTSGQVLTSTGTGVAWADDATGSMRDWRISDGFVTGTVTDNEAVVFEAGTKIDTTLLIAGGNPEKLTITHASTSRTDTTSSVAPIAGATFTVIDSVTQDTTGHPTAVNVKTVTLPAPGGPFLPLAGGTMLGNTLHGDNIKSIYGTGSDLEIYNDGSNSYFDNKTAGQNIIFNVNEFSGTPEFKIINTTTGDPFAVFNKTSFTVYDDGSELIKADSGAVELAETLKLSKGITNSLELKSYTATAVSTTGPIDPIQNNYAPTQDTLATLCVDTSGNVVRGEQEATFTFTTAQLNGTLGQTLISAPGAGKAVVVTYTDYMMTYTTTGSTTNDLEIRQANLASPTASVSRLPALRFNEIVNNSQAGVAPFYGFYTRDIPTGAGSQGRTYSVNSPTTIGKVNAGTWPAGLTSISIKIRYRVFDVATF